ncbi:4-(cytidine 5'-diphospho)-2-C-methyl-D-erythritol kinase [Haloferula sargassicola]|uniref:4-diphosphocytidyl-2-C-methyl-D-erythritol kinase n=1 Tax=Haloferula sargassicola TaxID=490096 RepID=A0ABP9UKL4_9BACT
MILEASAKLNLSLRVLGRRDDGFHELESLMVRLDGLADRLEIEVSDEDHFSCDAPGVPADDSNLVIKALQLFRRETGIRDRVRIRLEKRVPHGAGLGGGSSDAAAMLAGLNELSRAGLPVGNLTEMGARLGSDIPFFLGPPVAVVKGRGERIEEGPSLPSMRVVLLKPGFGVSTPDAYRRWQDSRELEGVDYTPQTLAWGDLVNDLERPVFQKHLFLAEVKGWLRRQDGVEAALMSGSGSTMFAVIDEKADADGLIARAREELDPTFWTWVGRTVAG